VELPEENPIEVRIPADLYRLISMKIQATGFKTVEDFATYVLRIAVGKEQAGLDEQDTEAVTERLKALGYI
jgi:hypothetical protein